MNPDLNFRFAICAGVNCFTDIYDVTSERQQTRLILFFFNGNFASTYLRCLLLPKSHINLSRLKPLDYLAVNHR